MYMWLDAKQPVDKLVDQIASSLAEAKHIGMFWSVGVMCLSSVCCFDVSVQKWYCSGIQQRVCCSLHTERWRAPCLADTVICAYDVHYTAMWVLSVVSVAAAAWPEQICTMRELTRLLRGCKALEHEYCT